MIGAWCKASRRYNICGRLVAWICRVCGGFVRQKILDDFTNAPTTVGGRASATWSWQNTPPSRIVTASQPRRTIEPFNATNMVINPTYLAQRTRSCKQKILAKHWQYSTANSDTAVNWGDAKKRVLHSYREWLRSVRNSGPQTMLEKQGEWAGHMGRGQSAQEEDERWKIAMGPADQLRYP